MTIASGTSGTSAWSIADDGKLTITPSSGNSGYILHGWLGYNQLAAWPWHTYRSQVTSVVISGSLQIYGRDMLGHEVVDGSAWDMFAEMENLRSVSGVKSLVGLTSLMHMFYNCSSLTSVDLASVNTAAVTDMTYAFSRCGSLTSLDLSSFDTSAVDRMYGMFGGCDALSQVVFGAGFAIPDGSASVGFVAYGKACKNVSKNIVVTSDADFRALTAQQRSGTWQRGVSATFKATAQRSTGSTADEDGEDVTISVTWATDASTTTRTLNVYKKLASSASYPSSASKTVTLSGNSGNEAVTISDIGDSAYDFKVEFYDGTNTFVAFPSVQSNIRLIAIDKSGHVEVLGEQCYPLFVWDSVNGSDTNPESYSGTYPVSPCFVYDKGTNGFYYCTDN